MSYVYWCYLPSSFFSSLQLLDLSHTNADIVKSSRISNLLSFQVCFFAELNDGALIRFGCIITSSLRGMDLPPVSTRVILYLIVPCSPPPPRCH